jgi:hypothetical protein
MLERSRFIKPLQLTPTDSDVLMWSCVEVETGYRRNHDAQPANRQHLAPDDAKSGGEVKHPPGALRDARLGCDEREPSCRFCYRTGCILSSLSECYLAKGPKEARALNAEFVGATA